MINTRYVAGVEAKAPSSQQTQQTPQQLPAADWRAAEAREAAAIAAAAREAAKIGVGVSALAQDTFDTLAKLYPCVWDASERGTIVVMRDVRVRGPGYGPDDATGPAEAVARVRLILARLASKRAAESAHPAQSAHQAQL